MKNIKISAKLLISFSIVIAMSIVVGVIGIFGMQQIYSAEQLMYNSNLRGIYVMGEIRENLQQQRVNMRTVIIFPVGTAEYDDAVAKEHSREESFNEYLNEYADTIYGNKTDLEAYNKSKDIYKNQFTPIKQQIFAAAAAGDTETAKNKVLEATPIINELVKLFDTSFQANNQSAIDADKSNGSLFTLMTAVQIGFLVLSVGIAFFFAFYISSIISKPMKFLAGYVGAVAATGNLGLVEENAATSAKYAQQKDEIGETLNAANSLFELMSFQGSILTKIAEKDISGFVQLRSERCTIGLIATSLLDTLNDVLSNIQLSANQVSSVSKQISDGSQALAQGSTEQAASVEELSASIADVADKTKKNSQMANQASDLGNKIKINAEKGTHQMDNLMGAVKEINDASLSINKVIKVIDDIAFQTNILALNAAVEAARAGSAGKGFAVVAEEVRTLAAKSAEAAKDTETLIANSIEKAHLGAKIAEETSVSLHEIVEGINQSSAIVDKIAESSEEQSLAISQIDNGINQVAQVVQQNSATSEESAASAEEMSSQAELLAKLSSQFTLRQNSSNTSNTISCSVPSKKRTTSNNTSVNRPKTISVPKTIDLDKY